MTKPPQLDLFPETREACVLPDGAARLYPGFLTLEEQHQLFDQLAHDIPWRCQEITLFGRKIMQPRLMHWEGDAAYTYSGLTLPPTPWSDAVADLRDRCAAKAKTPFNTALLNFYRNGQDSMGWHSDNEASLGRHPVIASLSLGTVRRFQFRKRADHREKYSVDLGEGDLLIMAAACQETWEHQLPKTKGCTSARLNITFRNVVA